MMIVSGASAITVLSPATVTLGAGPFEMAALRAAADADLRVVTEKPMVPVVESAQAANTNSGTSAASFTSFISPPGMDGSKARFDVPQSAEHAPNDYLHQFGAGPFVLSQEV
jgi:hypothetical protein